MTYWTTWRGLVSNPRRSGPEVEAFQLEALRRILRHSASSVPAFRRHYEGASAASLQPRSLADFRTLPTTDSTWYQLQPEEDRISSLVRMSSLGSFCTSGSSGKPLVVRRTVLETRLLEAFRLRSFFGYGGRVRDQRVSISFAGALSTWNDGRPRPRPMWQRVGILPRVAMDCVDPVDVLLERLASVEPDVLMGYGASVARVAAGLDERSAARIRPRFVMTGGEQLSSAMRRTIEQGFGVPVYDVYGATEANVLAWQCVETGLYHVCDDNVVLEVLRDGEPVAEGEEGEVAITTLHLRGMPFLRYRLGDQAVRGPARCPCGAPWSTIESIQGRTFEGVVLPDGTFLHHWWAVEPMLEKAPWMLSYRLVQSSPREITFEMVARGEPSRQELEAVESAGRTTFGADVEFRVLLVDEIAPSPSGKHARHHGL